MSIHARIDAWAGMSKLTVMAKKEQPSKLKISHRALIARIDRKLRPGGRLLRANRYGAGRGYAVIDADRHVVVEAQVDLEALARKLGVIRPWEEPA